MSSNKKTKTPERQLKVLKRLRKFIIVLEAIVGALIIFAGVVTFVPSANTALVKEMASTSIGRKIISWFGSEAYAQNVFDANFDDKKLKTNELKYKYSEEYTNFVMYGVDSRNGEVDASNSDSIMIVSIHNTTGEVKLVSVYRDTLLGIYDTEGNITKYFKVNSAYASGGAEAAINTLNMNLDLDITDYVTVNFAGVAEIIDTLGGIRVNLTNAEVSQLNQHMKSTISSTGKYAPPIRRSGKRVKLNGIQATTYCRIRKATFYDPITNQAISNDFGRAARQRLVIQKLVNKAKKASISELQGMVSAIMNDNTEEGRIISTSFSFDEIINMIPIIFDFELSGSEGFPSTLETGTIDGTSYVIPKGVNANVSALHEYLYGEQNYEPTFNVQTINNYVVGYTGIDEHTVGGYKPTDLTTSSENGNSGNEENTNYDYDDKGKSEFY